MPNLLDLFSGIGGISLGLSTWFTTVGFCESDPFCQAVLQKHYPDVPLYPDITTLQKEDVPEPIHCLSAGFPCQDISGAGLEAGLDGKRSGLVREVFRLSAELQPEFVFLENVAAITHNGLLQIQAELAQLGYDARWGVVSATSVGATHSRLRWFCLASHAGIPGLQGPGHRDGLQVAEVPLVADGDSHLVGTLGTESYWDTVEPPVCRVPDGDPNWAYRIRSLGNAAIPQQVEKAFRVLIGLEPLYTKPKCIP